MSMRSSHGQQRGQGPPPSGAEFAAIQRKGEATGIEIDLHGEDFQF